ncbi:MAG: dienelactone hydrolase family protein [Paracoccaceae bacterium]
MCSIEGCGSQTPMPPIKLSAPDRRSFLAGIIGLPLATVLAIPELAQAQAARLAEIEIPTENGGIARGVIAMPAKLPAPTVLLIHEWWGLNDQIKSVAAELAALGYIALAVDLYDGKVATSANGARGLMQALDGSGAMDQLATTVGYLRELNGSNGKVGTVGWCFGGGWSLNASIAAPVDATVIYYGQVTQPAVKLRKLSGPVMGHFGTRDQSINSNMVSGFAAEMTTAGKSDNLTVHWYDAHHAFANPTGSRYDQADAALAWDRTLKFFTTNLQS